MPRIRIRQHVNPLSLKFQKAIALPEWHRVYDNLNLPLHLDIGCARGKFLLEMAQLYPEINFLGVEIRRSLVIGANREKEQLGLKNLHYLFGSVNYSASAIFESLPPNILHCITVQFPDPWFKRKHNKRRVIQPELVDILVDYLVDGGTVFLQSDIKEVAIEMRDRFRSDERLIDYANPTWLDTNPLAVPTERELYVLKQNLPVYRALFIKAGDRLAVNS